MEDYDIIADLVNEDLEPRPFLLWDMNYLYDAFKRSMKGSSWKSQPQKFEQDVLYQLTKLSNSLENHTYEPDPTVEFVLNERVKQGISMVIQSETELYGITYVTTLLIPLLIIYLFTIMVQVRKVKGLVSPESGLRLTFITFT